MSPAKAPTTVYRDQLPLLGQHFHRNELRKQGAHQSLSLQHNQLEYQLLDIGDRVKTFFIFFFLKKNNENIKKINKYLIR